MNGKNGWAPHVFGLGVALGLSTLAWRTAMAGEPEAPESAIEDVVVTAEFRETSLQNTPLAITVIDDELIRARGRTNLSAIANQAPNVTLKVLGGSFGPALGASIRGVGQFDFNPALEPGIGIYVDDVYYPTLTGADLDLLDLDRVEILRGPQGTLAGRNAIGGAIRLITQKPEGSNTGYLEATYGSAQRIGFRGSADVALTSTLSAELSGAFKKQDGYVDRLDYGCLFPGSGVTSNQPAGHCKAGLDGGVGYGAVRGALRFRPSSRVDLLVAADFSRDDRTPAGEVLSYANLNNPNTNPAPGIPYDSRFICGKYCNYAANAEPAAAFVSSGPFNGYPLNATRGSDKSVFEGKGASANLDIALNDNLHLQSISAYREYDSSFNADDDLSPANIGFGQNELNHNFKSEELRLNGELGSAITYTVGGFLSDQKTTYYTYQDIRYAPIPLQFVGNDPVNANSQALFGTVNWSATDALNLSAGLRYTHEHKDYTFSRLDRDGTPNPFLGALTGMTGRYDGDHVDYRISADYRWNPSLMTYASISTGFRGGGINPRPFNVAQVQPFSIEEMTSYEIGTKSDLFDHHLRLDVSAFYDDYSDLQLTLNSCPQFGGPGPCALPQNAGDARTKGIEAEALVNLAEGLSLDGSLSYIDFEYVRVEAVTSIPKGDTRPYLPKWKWSLGAQYIFDLRDVGTLTPRIDASFQDSVYTNPVNGPNNFIPSYTVVDAHISWRNRDQDLEVSFEATNLSNEYYYLTKFDLSAAGAGIVKAQPGRPREFAITMRKAF